jgi:hypothetical protein
MRLYACDYCGFRIEASASLAGLSCNACRADGAQFVAARPCDCERFLGYDCPDCCWPENSPLVKGKS